MVLVIFKNAVQKYLQNSILLKPKTGQIKKTFTVYQLLATFVRISYFPEASELTTSVVSMRRAATPWLWASYSHLDPTLETELADAGRSRGREPAWKPLRTFLGCGQYSRCQTVNTFADSLVLPSEIAKLIWRESVEPVYFEFSLPLVHKEQQAIVLQWPDKQLIIECSPQSRRELSNAY